MSKTVPTDHSESVVENSWQNLRKFTDARIGLGRAGGSIPTRQLLEFQMDHANARDAVHIPLDIAVLESQLPQHPVLKLSSKANDRATYLQRPDLGRALSQVSVDQLKEFRMEHKAEQYKAVIVIIDGLSSTAVQAHAADMTTKISEALSNKGFSIAPISVVTQGRVAVGDEVGELLGVDLLIVLVGERPGLSSPDSLGIYYTYKPKVGLQDSSRNCISNVRPAGLSFQEATDKLIWLIEESIKLDQSGVMLKDESEAIEGITSDSVGNFLLEE